VAKARPEITAQGASFFAWSTVKLRRSRKARYRCSKQATRHILDSRCRMAGATTEARKRLWSR